MLLSHRFCKAGKNTAHVCLAISLLFSAGCANSEGAGSVPGEITGAAMESAIEESMVAATTARPADEKSSGTPFDLHGVLSVSGTQLVDKNGDAFQIKGVSTHGLSWYPEYVNENAFMTLRDQWGGKYCKAGNVYG